MAIHPKRKALIPSLLVEKFTVPAKYLDFADIFWKELAEVFLEQTRDNQHAIELEKGKEPPYEPIYNLGLVELKTLKIYIEINLANGFIRYMNFLANASIFCVCKPNSSLCLNVNYRGLNKLPIKNQYLLLLINKFFDQLGWAK